MAEHEHLFTPKQAAPLLGMHEKSVRILCAGGKLRHVLLGTNVQPRYKIPESAIDEYLRAHMVRRTA